MDGGKTFTVLQSLILFGLLDTAYSDIVFIRDAKTWPRATDHCASEGGQIWQITTDNMNSSDVELTKNVQAWIGSCNALSPWMEYRGCYSSDLIPSDNLTKRVIFEVNGAGICFIYCEKIFNATVIILQKENCYCIQYNIDTSNDSASHSFCKHCTENINQTNPDICGGEHHISLYEKAWQIVNNSDEALCKNRAYRRVVRHPTNYTILTPTCCLDNNCPDALENTHLHSTTLFRIPVLVPQSGNIRSITNITEYSCRSGMGVEHMDKKYPFWCVIDGTSTTPLEENHKSRNNTLTTINTEATSTSKPTTSISTDNKYKMESDTTVYLQKTTTSISSEVPGTSASVSPAHTPENTTFISLDVTDVKEIGINDETTLTETKFFKNTKIFNISERTSIEDIKDNVPSRSNLSSGSITGIVIGCVVFVALSFTVVVVYMKKRSRNMKKLTRTIKPA